MPPRSVWGMGATGRRERPPCVLALRLDAIVRQGRGFARFFNNLARGKWETLKQEGNPT